MRNTPTRGTATHGAPTIGRRLAALIALASPAAVLAACLSVAPPAPLVRNFDPLPVASRAGEGDAPAVLDAPPALQFVAAPQIVREFAVRTAPREVVFDPHHRWIAEPASLLAAAYGAPPGGTQAAPFVVVTAFELDLTAEPRAHLAVVLHRADRLQVPIEVWAPAAGRAPDAFAAAMADAIARGVEALRAAMRATTR